MEYSRRDLSLLLAAIGAPAASAAPAALPSKTWRFEDLPVRENGQNRSRAVFAGATHTGYPIDAHYTELAPGLMPHAAHRHTHEELIMIREGEMEVTISGKSTRVGPGGIAYIASGEEHGWRNVGSTRALYLVLAMGREKA